MPYIQEERKDELKVCEWPNDFLDRPDNPGELNYVLTVIILSYLNDPDSGNGPVNYEKYNSIMGVLSCIQHELYRRMIGPYENEAIKRNGDVYP